MHRTSFPKIIILYIAYGLLGASTSLAQIKPAGEIDTVRCWTYALSDAAGTSIAADGQEIILGRGGGRVDALSPDGKKIWSSEFGGEISSNIVPGDSSIFLVTSTAAASAVDVRESILRMVSKETGVTGWTLKLPLADSHFLYAVNGSLLVVSGKGTIQSLDARSGTLKWRREIAEGFVSNPALTSDRLFVATTIKQVFEIGLGAGEIDSLHTFPNDVTAITAASGLLVVGDERGNVSVLEPGSMKPRWKFRAGGQISSVLTIGDHLLVASLDNFVYFLGLDRGGLLWKKRLTGRTSYVAGSAASYVLVATVDGHSILFLNGSNGKVGGQILMADNEDLVSAATVNGSIYTLTNTAANAYAFGGCSATKNGGPGK